MVKMADIVGVFKGPSGAGRTFAKWVEGRGGERTRKRRIGGGKERVWCREARVPSISGTLLGGKKARMTEKESGQKER